MSVRPTETRGRTTLPVDRWVKGARLLTPPGLIGLTWAVFGPPFLILLGLATYGPGLMWDAFLHPDSGSLIWVFSPLMVFLGFATALALSWGGTPRRVGVGREGVTLEGVAGTRFVPWTEFYRPMLSLGLFGAIAYRVGKQRPRSVALSAAQAWELASAGNYSGWKRNPEIGQNGFTRAVEGRYRRLLPP